MPFEVDPLEPAEILPGAFSILPAHRGDKFAAWGTGIRRSH
jgi:hypothetical protein